MPEPEEELVDELKRIAKMFQWLIDFIYKILGRK